MRSLFSHGPMEKISEAEYRKLISVAPLKTERKTKYGNREITYQEAYQFADLPFDTIQWFNTSASVRSLLERLPIREVLRPQKSGIKPDLGTPMHFSEFMNNKLCDEVARCAVLDSPIVQPHVHSFTDMLYYNYDFGDDWHVQITASDNAENLI